MLNFLVKWNSGFPPTFKRDKIQKSVLYIEDDRSCRMLVEKVLNRRPNIKVLLASLAGIGIDMAFRHRPDLILLDLKLPDMDGFQVLEAIRCRKETKDIPIVFLSADAMPKDIEKGLSAGMDPYLTKPLNIHKLLELVDSILSVSEPKMNKLPNISAIC